MPNNKSSKNLDKKLKTHPEHIPIVIEAFQIYATNNNLNVNDVLADVTNISLDDLKKKHKKYKRKSSPYGQLSTPLCAYSYYLKDTFGQVKKKLKKKNASLKEVSKEVSKNWHKLDKKIKKKYELLSQKDKERYLEEKNEITSQLQQLNLQKPKRPLSAFMFFLKDFRLHLNQNNPDHKMPCSHIVKLAKDDWYIMTTSQKKKFEEQSNQDKERYHKEKEHYKLKMELLYHQNLNK